MKRFMKWFWVVIAVLAMFALVSCAAPTVSVADSDNPNVVVVGGSLTDANIYSLEVLVGGESKDHTEVHGSGSSVGMNGMSYGSISIWQDGKGLIPAKVLSITPDTPIVHKGDLVILKSEDLKMARLEAGWKVNIKCRMDYEPVQSLQLGEQKDKKYQTWELDLCRMDTPQYTIPVTVTPAEK